MCQALLSILQINLETIIKFPVFEERDISYINRGINKIVSENGECYERYQRR